MLIKAGRITNLTDARYFAAREVDYLGFQLEEGSVAYLDPMFMHAIREWVEGPRVTGEFTNSSPPEVVREAASFFRLDAVQVPADPAYDRVLTEQEVLVWLPAGTVQTVREQMAAWGGGNRLFILDFSGRPFPEDWPAWAGLCAEFRCLLHLDAAPGEWRRFAEAIQPAGFSLWGGEEEQVGVKSFDDLDAIFDELGR